MRRILIFIMVATLAACDEHSGLSNDASRAEDVDGTTVTTPVPDDYSEVHTLSTLARPAVAADANIEIGDTEWRLLAHGYQDYLIRVNPPLHATIEFTKEEGVINYVRGYDGCNHYSGAVNQRDRALLIPHVITTREACYFGETATAPDHFDEARQLLWNHHNEQYQFFKSVRNDIATYRIEHGRLTLTNSQSSMLVFVPGS